MLNKEILIYRNSSELRKYISSAEQPVLIFEFGKIQTQIHENADIVIDITSMVNHVKAFPGDQITAEVNLNALEDKTTIIVRDSCYNDAIELFPYYFCSGRYIYEVETEESTIIPVKDKTIYTYVKNEDLIVLRDYCEEKGSYILSFPSASGVLKPEIERTNAAMDKVIDLTSLAYAIEDNKNILYLSEQYLSIERNVTYIVKTEKADKILEYYPLFFSKQEKITNLYPDLDLQYEESSEDDNLVRIVDDTINLDCVSEYIDNRLFGHSNFKDRFKHGLNHFRRLNMAGELPIYSVFIFGKSGIGKTEVARLLAKSLREGSYLAKINFQNYSSQDALNSLIGSPAGYIGCEHGELSEKISKSRVGVLLCDEFEKTTRPVFSFFLQLLEEGKFTDSLAREYDLNGYVVIFTSNLQTEAEYKKTIPPELQTRFDLVCEFNEPTLKDKEAYLQYLLQTAKTKVEGVDKLNSSACRKLTDLHNYCSTSLRELKKEFNNYLLDELDKQTEMP